MTAKGKHRPTSIWLRIPSGKSDVRYPLVAGHGVLSELGVWIARMGKPSRFHVVADSSVWRLWRARIAGVLASTDVPWSVTRVPSGERSKSAAALTRLWRDLVRSGCDRHTWVIAVGGGMVGDLSGFAAASVLRGIDFVQVPTTLLSMVDASVGGKTGINLPEGKNLVGAFHQPRAVFMDLDFLETLPERELRSGWAEVVKTAAILDGRLFARLERQVDALRRRDGRLLASAILATARLKAHVVRLDERESGLRMILNFGHTLAHAIETVQRYGTLLHGEAVAIGMVFAARLGVAVGATPRVVGERLVRLISAFGLPCVLPRISVDALLAAMSRDKKRGPEGLRWVFLDAMGSARIDGSVSPKIVRRQLEEYAQQRQRGAPR